MYDLTPVGNNPSVDSFLDKSPRTSEDEISRVLVSTSQISGDSVVLVKTVSRSFVSAIVRIRPDKLGSVVRSAVLLNPEREMTTKWLCSSKRG